MKNDEYIEVKSDMGLSMLTPKGRLVVDRLVAHRRDEARIRKTRFRLVKALRIFWFGVCDGISYDKWVMRWRSRF